MIETARLTRYCTGGTFSIVLLVLGLFLPAGAVEGRVLSNPSNTIRSYMLGEFRKRGWPKNPPGWKQYFLEHHVETLF